MLPVADDADADYVLYRDLLVRERGWEGKSSEVGERELVHLDFSCLRQELGWPHLREGAGRRAPPPVAAGPTPPTSGGGR